MHHHNGAASFAAGGSMQLLTAAWTLPLLWAPAVIACRLQRDSLLALALSALHEGNAQLVTTGLARPLPATVGVPQHPLGQVFPTPAEDPARQKHCTALHSQNTALNAACTWLHTKECWLFTKCMVRCLGHSQAL